MVKPETHIRYFSNKEMKKQEVLAICIGDINGDGKKEIIFGGGNSQTNDNLIYVAVNPSTTDSYLFEIETHGGYLKHGICFDIDDDGKDEIICGTTTGRIFYIDFLDNNYKIIDILSLPINEKTGLNRVEDIKGYNFKGITLLFSCTSAGNLNLLTFQNGEKKFEREIRFSFPVWSLNPFVLKDILYIILGGGGEPFDIRD